MQNYLTTLFHIFTDILISGSCKSNVQQRAVFSPGVRAGYIRIVEMVSAHVTYLRKPVRLNDAKGTGPFVLASFELNKSSL